MRDLCRICTQPCKKYPTYKCHLYDPPETLKAPILHTALVLHTEEAIKVLEHFRIQIEPSSHPPFFNLRYKD